MLDEVRNDLAVYVGREGVTGQLELGSQCGVVLEHSVVDDRHLPRAVQDRVCDVDVDSAVCRPPGVSDSSRDVGREWSRVGPDLVEKVCKLALRPSNGKSALIAHSQAGGVVAAILQVTEAVERSPGGLRSPGSHDSAHRWGSDR